METKSLTTAAAELLKAQILAGELAGGEKLNENQISTQLSISRPPLREAFRLLEQERLVVSIPRKGRCVTKLTKENFFQVQDVRRMIECHVIDILKENKVRRLPKVKEALIEAIKLPVPLDNTIEKLRYIEITGGFHIKLVESTGNDLLNHFYGIIRSIISRYRYISLSAPGFTSALLEEHQQILNLIERGSYNQAKQHLSTHLEWLNQHMSAIPFFR